MHHNRKRRDAGARTIVQLDLYRYVAAHRKGLRHEGHGHNVAVDRRSRCASVGQRVIKARGAVRFFVADSHKRAVWHNPLRAARVDAKSDFAAVAVVLYRVNDLRRARV